MEYNGISTHRCPSMLFPIKVISSFLIVFILLVSSAIAETNLFAVSYTTYDTTYDAILKMYIKVLNAYGTSKTGRHDLFNELIISDFNSDYEAPLQQRINSTKNKIGFCIYDLNDDGIDELIIGENPADVSEVFTIDAGRVRELIRAGYNYNCALLENGRFYREMRDGAAWESYAVWSMHGVDKVHFSEGFIRDDMSNIPTLPESNNGPRFFKMIDSKPRYGTADNLVDNSVFLSWLKKLDQKVLQLRFVPLAFYEQGYESDYDKIGIISVNGKTTGSSTVRIRSKASNKSKVLKSVKVGTYVIVLGEDGNYYHVQFGKKEGYVQKEYLSLLSDSIYEKKYNIDYASMEAWIESISEK